MIKKYILAAVALALAVLIGFFWGREVSAPAEPINSVVIGIAR